MAFFWFFFEGKIEKHDNSGPVSGAFLGRFGSFLDPFGSDPLSCMDDFGCALWSTKIEKHDNSGPVSGAFLGRFGSFLDPFRSDPLLCLDDFGLFLR